MTTLKKTIIATNLDQVLSSTGPYTFFAPSDAAFAKLEANEVDDLLKKENTEKLSDLLNSHLVEGKIVFRDLEDGQKLKTINGKELSVQVKNGTVHIDKAEILGHDMKTSNGVIHCLDTVLN
ncbi:MAG: fasciclin protein [Chitinophagaceae bacterium]|jgi:uncharacterized surface protein with fasciclin (FAS1) repeats|nr:fasciclin protein [Chitinophagaceae bacterium]